MTAIAFVAAGRVFHDVPLHLGLGLDCREHLQELITQGTGLKFRRTRGAVGFANLPGQ